MYATDFEYDGKFLSDFGFIVCRFDGGYGLDTISSGSEITFNKVARNQGKVHSLTSAKYSECIQATFQICKNPCIHKNKSITSDEHREVMRWLNRKEFLTFQPFSDIEYDADSIFFNASFNVNKITIGGKHYGYEIIMETDKPFGYGNLRSFKWNITSSTQVNNLKDCSDEIGFIYPNVKIVCKAAGDLIIRNANEDCNMTVKNCKNNEIVTVNGDTQIIASSLSDHDIAADFNFDFLKIGNRYDNRDNKITVSLPCEITISYYPIIKDIP